MRRLPLLLGLLGLGTGLAIGFGGLPGVFTNGDPIGTTSGTAAPSALPVPETLGPDWRLTQYTPETTARCPLRGAAVYPVVERQYAAYQSSRGVAVFMITRYQPGDAPKVLEAIATGGEDCWSFSDDAGAWSVTTVRGEGRATLTMLNVPKSGGAPLGIEGRYFLGDGYIASQLVATPNTADPALGDQLEAIFTA